MMIIFHQQTFMVYHLNIALFLLIYNSGCYQWQLLHDQASFWNGIDERNEHQHVNDTGTIATITPVSTTVDNSEAQQFYEEIFESLQVGLDEGTSVKNLILEINSSR